MKQKMRSQHRQIRQTLAELTYESYLTHCTWIERAQELAHAAGERGEIPVGALIVDSQGKAIAKAANCKESNVDPTAHAEMVAIREACKVQQSWCLKDCTLYVNLEPCPMCAGAIIQSRLSLLVYGADEPKTGAIRTVTNLPDSYCSHHRLKVLAGIRETSCRQQIQAWFANKRLRRSSKL